MHPRTALALFAVLVAPSVSGEPLAVSPEESGIRVHVSKQGLFSAFAHDHDFEVTHWHGTAEIPDDDPERAVLEVVLEADSLRDREPGLSSSDRSKVEAQTVGPDILDAVGSPEITYRAGSVSLEGRPSGAAGPLRGMIHGVLSLRGRSGPVDASFEATREADAWHVRGKARFRQSEFGIKPFVGFGGTVGVKDQVEVTFELALR